MPWVKRKRKVVQASTDARKAPAQGPYRCVLPDGTIEETSAAMGKVFIVFADPCPAALDLGADAGWERWQAFRRRLGGG
jgi:hypothetical protein